jgi:putative FmdB family regulatory protein
MPLYEYVCRSCKHEFEALVRPQDPPPQCKSCQSQDLERLLSAASMSTADQTRTFVGKERARRLPKHRAEQNEEYQHTLKEHLHDE